MRRLAWVIGALAAVGCSDATSEVDSGAGGVGGFADAQAGGAGGGAGGAGGEAGDATVADMGAPDMELPPIEWVTPAAIAEAVDGVPPNDGQCRAAFVGAFRGWIADQSGRPIEGAKAQACVVVSPGGSLVCLRPADTGPDGVYTINVPEGTTCISTVAMRVLRPGGVMATNYCNEVPADLVGADGVIRTADPYVIYPTDAAAEVPELGLDDTGTVRYADGLEVDFTPGRMFPTSGTWTQARARRIDPTDRGLCFLKDQPAPAVLYGFAPEAAIDDAGFPVRIPNTEGLAAGATVDLYVLGGLECSTEDGTKIHEGEWTPYGTGTVAADGAMIASDPGSELPCFTWLGYTAQ